MNFLVHQFILNNDLESRQGNYLGDFIKGLESILRLQYPAGIVDGIMHHRRIDRLSDENPAIIQATKILKPHAGKFSHIIVDILFDYFLIKHWDRITTDNFELFIKECYSAIGPIADTNIYPESCRFFTGQLIEKDTFHKYATLSGLHDVFCKLNSHLRRSSPLPEATKFIELEFDRLEQSFMDFMPVIVQLREKSQNS